MPRLRSSPSLFLSALALLAACQGTPSPAHASARPPAKRYDIDTLLGSRQLAGAALSPDGTRVLFSSNRSGVINAYEVPFADGAPAPLTRSTTDSIFALRYFPDDLRVLYSSDQGGNELDHVFVRASDGAVRDLTPGAKHKAMFMGFAHDERSFFVAINERDPRYFDVYEYDAATYARSEFYRNDRGLMPGPISYDKQHIALSLRRTTNDTDVIVCVRASGEHKKRGVPRP
jgi:hypothetical protein